MVRQMKTKTLLLVDGHYLAFRSFFAFPGHLSYRGIPINAVYGFVASLFSVIETYNPDYLGVCFDRKEPTFRHIRYPLYKAQRPAAPEAFIAQIPILHTVLNKMGIQELSLAGYEADDLIGTLSRVAQENETKALILSGDMDDMQLVSEYVNILVPQKAGEIKVFGPAEVHEKYGFSPNQVTFFKGLRGDPSDNIPGVPGIGEKSALVLVNQFRDLHELYAGTSRIESKSIREKIETNRESAELSVELATINREVPIDLSLCDLEFELDWEKVLATLAEYEFKSLLKRYQTKISKSGSDEVVQAQPKAFQNVTQTINPNYRSVNTIDELKAVMPLLKNGFAIDTETTSKSALESELVGISISNAPGESFYIPLNKYVKHESRVDGSLLFANSVAGHKTLALNPFTEILKPILEDPTIPKITHNGKYEWLVFRRYGITLQGIEFDTMLAASILFPGQPLGLKDLSSRLLNIEMTTFESLTGKGKLAKKFTEVPIEYATEYACADADMTLRLTQLMRPMLLGKQLELFNEIEIPLQIVLAEMEWEGVTVNIGYLNSLYSTFLAEGKNVEEEVIALAGQPFNLNSPKQISEILFDKLGLPAQKKTKTGASTDASVLERLSHLHPIAALLLRHRTLEKLNNTYVSVLPQLVNSETGRIHTSFNQCGAITGRLSSNNPNIQNIPIRTEEGKMIRKAFISAGPDRSMVSADYSQIELRVLAHLADETGLIHAFNNHEDIHSSTAATIYRIPLSAVTKDQRYRAKAVNFGIIYGQSAFGLSETLGISRGEAKEMIDHYFATFPKIQSFISETISVAESEGSVQTLYGRIRPIPDIHSSNAATRQFAQRTAVNTRVQGSAADIIKIAMIRIQKQLNDGNWLSKMIIQVHDELVFDADKTELDRLFKLVRTEMMGAAELKVPLEVDIGAADNWLDA